MSLQQDKFYHQSGESYQVGYKVWVLWLIILFDTVMVAACIIVPFGAIIEKYSILKEETNSLPSGLIAFLVCFGTFFLCHLTTVLKEAFRNGYAIKIDKNGIHLWRATKTPIPWHDIESIIVYDIVRDSRFITLMLNRKVLNFSSPYIVINLLRGLSLRRYSYKLKMFLDGVACDNQTLREQISIYSNKLEG